MNKKEDQIDCALRSHLKFYILQIDADFSEIHEDPETLISFKEDILSTIAENLFALHPGMMGLIGDGDQPCRACVQVNNVCEAIS